jgi:uncharacterized membrane protein YozB (DUF420 family)
MLSFANGIILRIPYWLVYVVLAAAFLVISSFVPDDDAVVPRITLSDPGKTSVDIVLATMQLVTGLNTAVLAAAGATAVKGKEWSLHWSRADGLLLVLVAFCVIVSYFGIYLTYMSLLGMSIKGKIDPLSWQMRLAFDMQYYGMILGAFILGLIFVRMLEVRRKPEEI